MVTPAGYARSGNDVLANVAYAHNGTSGATLHSGCWQDSIDNDGLGEG